MHDKLTLPERLELALADGAEKTSLQLSLEIRTICVGSCAADLRKRWRRKGIVDRQIICTQRMVDGVNIPSYKIVCLNAFEIAGVA
jgi:hypothetical protein